MPSQGDGQRVEFSSSGHVPVRAVRKCSRGGIIVLETLPEPHGPGVRLRAERGSGCGHLCQLG
jgi:hypothetical protein